MDPVIKQEKLYMQHKQVSGYGKYTCPLSTAGLLLFISGFPTKSLYVFLISSMRATCPIQFRGII